MTAAPLRPLRPRARGTGRGTAARGERLRPIPYREEHLSALRSLSKSTDLLDHVRSDERCEPTRTMGTGGFWIINARAEAVWCMVSVP